MNRIFLGVDTGGSKSHAMLADESGRVLAIASGGSGNPDEIGYGGLTELLSDLLIEACRQAEVGIGNIHAAGFGIAGLDWDSQIPAARQAVNAAGLTCPFEVVNDIVLGLYAGAQAGWGVAVGAGTGCNCRGRDRNGREGRMVGYGLPFGEAAGATELVEWAVRAVALAWTQRGEPTSLSEVFVRLAGVSTVAELLEGLALGRVRLSPQNALAIIAEAQAGDAVAGRLMAWAGSELASMVCGVARQLNFGESPFEVVTMGSLFRAGEMILTPFRDALLSAYPLAEVVQLTAAPVCGAALLGMQAGGMYYQPVRDALLSASQGLFNADSQL